MADKISEILLLALKQAMADASEKRLFKSGKLPGLFSSRTGANADAASRALSEGLLKIVRSETKGKFTTDWVLLTPKGTQFVYEQESPSHALADLKRLLAVSRENVPVWLAEMRCGMLTLATQLTEEAQRWTHRIDALANRVEQALRRSEAGASDSVNGSRNGASWSAEALAYLDRRRDSGVAGNCTLPELFAALRERHADLSVSAFHDGLRRLRDRQALTLLPFTGDPGHLSEPEYALLDGSDVLYYAAR